jgi:hypothetical protein
LKNNRRGPGACLAALALLLLVASGASADFSLDNWRFYKDITLPAGIQSGDLVELAPDAETFATAVDGLADLRVVSGQGQEIPYKLELSQAESERTSFPVSIRDKGYVPGSHTIFTADLGKGGILHNEIEFSTPADDFRRMATVEASNDGSTWARLVMQTVYAFTVRDRGFTTRNTAIRYPESTARYLRVSIADDGGGDLEITGATVFYVKETAPKMVPWPSSILSTTRDEKQRTTNVVVDLGSPGLPTSQLRINTADENFYRQADVQSSADQKDWRRLDTAGIFAFDTPKFVGAELEIIYPETTARYLRLVIHDEDNPPLNIQSVDIWGVARRLVFAADPARSYRLYYGNGEARKPSYDIERIFPYLITEGLPEAQAGPQAANPDFREPEAPKPPLSERFPWLLPVVIATAAIIVGILLFIVFRQVRKSLPPPQE